MSAPTLTPDEQAELSAGHHEELAAKFEAQGRHALAGWVREQIWDFGGAQRSYTMAGQAVDALRMALEDGSAAAMDEAVAALEAAGGEDPEVLTAAIAQLQRRGRHLEVARLMAVRAEDPATRAAALQRGGDRLGAARTLADAGAQHEALQTLMPMREDDGDAQALAASLYWDLGDAEGAARHAQAALREGGSDEVVGLLARALGSLGHDLAAQIVLEGRMPPEAGHTGGLPGRYRVTGIRPAGLVGAAYVGFDRITLAEVELHLLLAEHGDMGQIDEAVAASVDRFGVVATAASDIGHPAIRAVLRFEGSAGLLVLPRAEGPSLRSLIRPPGMATTLSRARALAAFMLEGLRAAHRRGLVHGWLLPSQIVCDAAGRPLLGPFGAYHLAGLAATHTGGLDELLAVTAPELAGGGTPTIASDVYAVGALLRALLVGNLRDTAIPDLPDLEILSALLEAEPDRRPSATEALEVLRAPVADIRELESTAGADPAISRSGASSGVPIGPITLQEGVEVDVAASWSDELVDLLCSACAPWLQPILDRSARHLVLAPWPSGARSLGAEAPEAWRDLVPTPAWTGLPIAVREAIEARLQPSSLVVTESGQWMLALDDLLVR